VQETKAVLSSEILIPTYQATRHKVVADGYSHPVVPRYVSAAVVSTLQTTTNKGVASRNTDLLKATKRKSSQEIVRLKKRIKIPCLMQKIPKSFLSSAI